MSDAHEYPLLSGIDDPSHLRELPASRLPALAVELRQFVLQSVAQSGGHLAAGLGTVELTIALHYAFDTPHDRLVWDVGHQCYPHKVLTGRRRLLSTIRQRGGLAGFPKREESEYDTFGVGHSSTSISAALGMSLAASLLGVKRRTVAIIGDGGMTAGEAFEALNHAGDVKADLLVVLNDNEMSISENVGALSSYLTRLLSGRGYASLRDGGKRVLRHMPPIHELARRAEEHMKGMLVPSTLFEELGFEYYGPIDGHDLPTLVKTLQNLGQQHGPRLLHVVTRKGKGYKPAEDNPIRYHGVSTFDPKQGLVSKTASSTPSYTEVFGQWLCDMAAQDRRLVGITPAMREGSGMVKFAETYPSRYYDVGIAEQHSVTVAAGMACEGAKPVVAIYSTFLQRGYDQVVHDVALQKLPVLFAIDRAGLVGPDGPTHAGSYDLSYLRCLPDMAIMAPADENECRQMLYTGFLHDGPAAVRYPRGKGPGVPVTNEMEALPFGKGEIRREGKRLALLAFGSMLAPALEVAEKLDMTVANMRFVKPLDEELILDLAQRHELLVTLEENVVAGGAGGGVSELLAEHGLAGKVRHIGLPDCPIEHGSREEMLADAGLDAESILARIAQY
ncbi:1-deoxy-D-xylulose-5-phosphate synthase [Alkalilimnicola ehrlichii]|uniref:1-deoxy-D-xylulose-5-phosphate synthase n=1 Tax=Alkalilimnicola ehrlichii TaxID=351052 RepID=UPI000E2FF240|nr:1-deoxy-D-xylulose-5-phosphate synthase [Alkalilimnicola ehrlichii]RFA28973.1 1-deoxy-D-xylulose-5-phosphate synthase [Alkalilimnicola ehrlichii]